MECWRGDGVPRVSFPLCSFVEVELMRSAKTKIKNSKGFISTLSGLGENEQYLF